MNIRDNIRVIETALKAARRLSYGARYGGLAALDKEIVAAQKALREIEEEAKSRQLEMTL